MMDAVTVIRDCDNTLASEVQILEYDTTFKNNAS